VPTEGEVFEAQTMQFCDTQVTATQLGGLLMALGETGQPVW